MLSKQKRLTTSRVEYVLKKGNRFGSSKFFNARFVVTSRNESRFCVIVSLKVAPGAVERNRLRRQIYETLRLAAPHTVPADIVLIAKPAAAKLTDVKELETEITSILKQLK